MRLAFFAILLFFISLVPFWAACQGLGLIPAEKQRLLHLQANTLVAARRAELVGQRLTATEIEFRLDTFGVEAYFDKCNETLLGSGVALTDADMAALTYDRAQAYDSLLNKYYKRLSMVLKEDDRKVLVQAQRAWLAFRDNEGKLRVAVGMASTGGGTMLQLTESGSYLEMVRARVVELYEYYDQVVNHF